MTAKGQQAEVSTGSAAMMVAAAAGTGHPAMETKVWETGAVEAAVGSVGSVMAVANVEAMERAMAVVIRGWVKAEVVKVVAVSMEVEVVAVDDRQESPVGTRAAVAALVVTGPLAMEKLVAVLLVMGI